jgi:hypothetical protein
MNMKRTLLALALIATSSAVFAAGMAAVTTPSTSERKVCDGAATSGKTTVYGGDGTAVGTPSYFVQQGFTVQCSANVLMSFQEQSATLAVVASGSVKGNQAFGGSTNGGAIASVGTCTDTNNACKAQDISTGLATAITAATSTQ